MRNFRWICPNCAKPARIERLIDLPSLAMATCPKCELQRIVDAPNTRVTALRPAVHSNWDHASVWESRETCLRLFRAIVQSRIALYGGTRDEQREFVKDVFAECIEKSDMGAWYNWTPDECAKLQRYGNAKVIEYADLLTGGEDRLRLQIAKARLSRFPRVSLLYQLTRDRVRLARQSMLQRATAYFGKVFVH